jgi:hypothetical protein
MEKAARTSKDGRRTIRKNKKSIPMSYKDVVKGNVIELEGEVTLPEGTRVNVIPERPVTVLQCPLTLKEWLQEARQVRAQLLKTSDSVEILQQLREKR